MPPIDYDYLIGAARAGDRTAKLYLDYLAANKKIDSFLNSGGYQYSPVIDDPGVAEGSLPDNDTGMQIDVGSVDNVYKDIDKQRSSNDWASGALSLMNGATGIINTTRNMARTADTSMQRNMIQDIGNIGSSNYGNIGQAISDINRIDSMQPDLSLDTYRGGSDKERVGGLFSNIVTGATTGAQVGGIYGAIGGAVLGGAAGGYGIWANNQNALAKSATDAAKLSNARDRASINAAAGIEDLQDDEHRNKLYNVGVKGGKMNRSRYPIKSEKVKGGTKIKIRR